MVDALQRAIANPEPVVGIGEHSPLSGLHRRSVGFVDVLAQSVSAVAPSAAATTMPVLVAAAAGSASVWAIGAAMLIALLVGVTVNVFARRMASTGSLYTYVAKGLGPGPSLLTGASMVMGYGFVAVFALTGGGYYLAILIGHFWAPASRSALLLCALVVGMAALCFLVLARGIRISTRVTLLIEAISVTIILALVVALIALQGGGIQWSALSLEGTSPIGLVAGAALGLTAFVGFESAATLGVEARRPYASIPRAIIWTVIAAGIIFLLAAYSQLVGFAEFGRSLVASSSPVNELASAYGIEWVGLLLDASIASSFVACAIASTTALSRVLFAMSRDGLLPARLGGTHARFRTPIVAIGVALPTVTLVTLVMIGLTGSAWGAMQVSIVCAATGYMVAYAMVCAAAPVFLRRIGEATVMQVARSIVTAVLLTAVLAIYLIWESTTAGVAGVVISIVLLTGAAAVYVVVDRRRPGRWRDLGSYDEPVQSDLLAATRSIGVDGR